MIRQPGPFPHVCYRHALDCIYLLPSGGGLDSRWSIVVASGDWRDVSESAAQDECGQARAESAAHGRPLARRWRRLRRSRAPCGRGPGGGRERVRKRAWARRADERPLAVARDGRERLEERPVRRKVRRPLECERRATERAPDAAVDPAGRRVRARAREAQRARHVAAGRARGCDGRRQADGALLGRENRSAAGRRRRARIVPRQRGRRRRPFEMTVRPVVARAHVPGARRGRVHPVQVLARRPFVADPPAAAVAQDAEPTAVDVPPPRGVVLCAAASIDAIRPRVARPGDEDFAVGRWSARHGRRHGPEKPIVVSSFE